MNWTRSLPRVGALGVALSIAAAGASRPRDARASVSIAVEWDALLHASTSAALVTPTEAHAVWEGGRIYTYTQVRVDRAVAGELAPGGLAWVRTRGGIVGNIGQQVEGEAVFSGTPSLVFLHLHAPAVYEVTARAQGQFSVATDDPAQPAHLVPSRSAGMLVPRVLPSPALPGRLAADVLSDRTLDDAAQEIAAAWSGTHAHAY
jgi:hypothetical protein